VDTFTSPEPRRRWFLKRAGGTAALALLSPPSAFAAPHRELAGFDVMMADFLKENRAPGASLAISKDGRLVYARGFGLADRESGEAVAPESLFRIASIAKPFTAVAVLRLAGQGRLSLDGSAWELLQLAEPADRRWKRVTILHLLQHTGGWDRDKRFDPMFRSSQISAALSTTPPAGPPEIIRYMLGQPLDFEPGSRHAYSNFGYSLLGRVIERASGKPYGAYVAEELLKPLGIRRMQLGRTLREQRAPGEVAYYDELNREEPAVTGPIGKKVPLPYGRWALESMDAHGGWIASAADLVRFACAFDDSERSPLLSASGIAQMLAPPEGPAGRDADGAPLRAHFGCGWQVRPRATADQSVAWHYGSLAGSSTLLARAHHRVNFAVLFNTRANPEGRLLAPTVLPLLHKAANRVQQWPETNLFPALL
jgi:N-acyl-D-amino-acid deacylase